MDPLHPVPPPQPPNIPPVRPAPRIAPIDREPPGHDRPKDKRERGRQGQGRPTGGGEDDRPHIDVTA